MKKSLVVLSVLCFVFLRSDLAEACSCRELTPCEAFGYSSAVFVGRMLGGTEKVREYTKDGQTFSVEAGESRFAVEESFKGVAASEVAIHLLNMKGTSCEGMGPLVRGQRYLVYASYLDSVKMLAIGPCSPTKSIDYAKVDLEFLRRLPAEGTGGRIYGELGVEVGGGTPSPLPDVSIVVEDEAHVQHQAKTNKNGEYEIAGLRPGKYVVNPILPENYVSNEYQQNRAVEVSDRGCSQASFWVSVNGRVSGRVTDLAGRPAPAYVVLESNDRHKRRFTAQSDEEGNYEIEGIPAGSYVLKIELKKGREEKDYYYPDTTDRTKATLITLSMAQQISGKDLHLPFQTYQLQGSVAYSDGRPASGVEVRLIPVRSENAATYQVDEMYTDTTTNENGHFSLRGYKGVTYSILALDNTARAIAEDRMPWARTETSKMLIEKDTDDIKLIMPLTPRAKTSTESQKPSKPPTRP